MRKIRFIVPLALACRMFAGGFWLQLGNPEASTDAKKANAAIYIKATGCHDPATAQISATAVGVVDGRRQTIDLKVTPLTEPGTFAIAQQWPKSGHWVIQLVGKNGEQFTNTLVNAGPDGIDRLHAKSEMKPFRQADVDMMLGN